MYYEQGHQQVQVDCARCIFGCERMSWWLGSPRSVVRPTPLVRTERLELLRRLEPARSTFEACNRNLSNSWDSKPNCSLWLRHFSSRSRTFDYTDRRNTHTAITVFYQLTLNGRIHLSTLLH